MTPRTTRRTTRWSTAAGLVATLGLVLGGCAGPAGNPPAGPASPPAAVHTTTSPAAPAGLPRSVPVSIDIPKLGARSSLIQLGLNPDGTVAVPPVSTPMQAGWFDGGPTPGEIGPAVVLGHVDGDHQLGIFFRLHELAPGDQVLITRQDGRTVSFRVTRVDQTAKTTFPTDAVYGNTPDAELRLITCGGSFDRTARSYRDSIIVYAAMT